MLELERKSCGMPANLRTPGQAIDFATYLLAASPPGVEFLSFASMREQFTVPATPNKTSKELPAQSMAPKLNEVNIANHIKTANGGKKKVCFADDLGYDLVTVKVMTESSDSPPMLRKDIISKLTEGLEPKATEQVSFVLNFAQPAADYLVFRDKVDRCKVSLENVILKGRTVSGTVKVVNIAFEKKVIVRYTCNNWASHTDVNASYVPVGHNGQSKYDAFSFEFDIPSDAESAGDSNKHVVFCICYETQGQQFWDNNDDKNYEILKVEVHETQTQLEALSIHDKSGRVWSEFTAWTGVDNSIPYW